MDFIQEGPKLHHPYLSDKLLQALLVRYLPSEFQKEVQEDLTRFGTRVIDEMEELSQEAERITPVHVPYDPWGKRIDEIKVTPAWNRLHEIAAEEGIVAIGYERKQKEFSRLYQFAKLYLYHPSSAIYSCPLAMTDGAARLIELFGTEGMKERALKFLTSRDPEKFWTSGQWMTEKSGGSDVSGTSTIAKKEGEQYKLYGIKWFTSATTSQMAMTLAHVEGDDKLSLFYLELRDEEGNLNGIQINRLKDKMGTKALPTAELTLSGVPAVLVGEQGKGIKTIATLFNITRLYNACCAVGYMRRGLSLALDYSTKRKAFGRAIIDHGLHAHTLSELQVFYEACMMMSFHSAYLLGKVETEVATEVEKGTLRLLIPLVKLYTAKMGVQINTEVIESFGGAGYIEDTGLPQILRNSHVLSIWEGTTNVLSLDALRAINRENAGIHFAVDVKERMEKIKDPELVNLRHETLNSLKKVIHYLQNAKDIEDLNTNARTLAMNMSRVYCASLLLEHAEWENSKRSKLIVQRYVEMGLFEEFHSNAERREEEQIILFQKEE
ncbi:MAG: acyl-CoA dehydrogenase family protein [Candidatus Caldatribacteriota bacterium]